MTAEVEYDWKRNMTAEGEYDWKRKMSAEVVYEGGGEKESGRGVWRSESKMGVESGGAGTG